MSDQNSVYTAYQGNSYLFGGNAPYVEEMYENYLANPGSVPDTWRQYFDALQHVPANDGTNAKDVPHLPVVNAFAQRAKQGGTKVVIAAGADLETARKRTAVQQLIAAYRNVGVRWADLDPLKRDVRENIPELEPSFYGFSDADQEAVFNTSNTFFGKESMSLRDLMNALRETYCGTIGAEFMYISDQNRKRWWQQKLESIRSKPQFGADKKKHILDRLTASEGLERFLHTKYVGQKRFSLEGGESFIASMDELVQRAGEKGVQEIVIGMAHRGRLNVLVNTLGKMPADLFAEFDHTAREDLPSGDVKYHQGFSSDVSSPGGPVHLTLAFNPSHLEIVNPVVEGSVRARMDRRGDPKGKQVLPVLVHGDAAIAGQGVVMETLALAETRGYFTGGTVHLVINNQIGFTTSDPRDARSTLYCTDVAKMVEAPIFHVNGDDPDAVPFVTQRAPGRGPLRPPARARLQEQVPQGRGDRHRLLQEARPQRAGRAVHHAAADVQEDRAASGRPQALRREARRAGHLERGGARSHDQALPRNARRRPADREPGALELQEQVRGRLGAIPEFEVDRRRRHARAAARAAADGRARDHDAGRLPCASDRRPRDRGAQANGGRQGRRRLGHGGDARLCLPSFQRLRRPAPRPRPPPRAPRPPPRGAARPGARALGRRQLRAAAERLQGSRRFRRHRFGA